MKRLVSFALLVLTTFSLCYGSSVGATDHNQLVLVDKPLAIFRGGRPSDIDDIATTILDAFSPGDDWAYIYPDYEKHKEQIWLCARAHLHRNWLNSSSDGYVKVVAASKDDTEEKVISFGWWESRVRTAEFETRRSSVWPCISVAGQGALAFNGETISACPLAGRGNATRIQYVSQTLNEVHNKYTQGLGDYFELVMLATHPTWDGNGFAAMSVNWGLEYARQSRLPAVVVSSRVAYPLYRSLGFELLKNLSIPKLDEPGHLLFHMMKQDFV